MRQRPSLAMCFVSACAALLLLASAAWSRPLVLHAHDAGGAAFDLERLRGQVVAISFVSRYTQRDSGAVNQALGAQARAQQVAVVSIVDFVGIPRLFHGFARSQVAKHDRPDRVKLLVDEQSRLGLPLGVAPRRGVEILIIDANGDLRGHFYGPQGATGAVQLIDALREQAPPRT